MTPEQLHKEILKLWKIVEQQDVRIESLEMQVFPNMAGEIQQRRVQRIVAGLDRDTDLVGG